MVARRPHDPTHPSVGHPPGSACCRLHPTTALVTGLTGRSRRAGAVDQWRWAGHDLIPSAHQLVGPIRLIDTLNLAVMGGLAGRGRRAGIYGALLLAVYDQEADRFQTIRKVVSRYSPPELTLSPNHTDGWAS